MRKKYKINLNGEVVGMRIASFAKKSRRKTSKIEGCRVEKKEGKNSIPLFNLFC